MKPTLIRTNGEMPPGGFPFLDPITGKGYRDMESSFDARVGQIINDRLANKRLIRKQEDLSPTHVAQELSEQVCQKLNGNPRFCNNSTKVAPTPEPPVANKVCIHCGAAELRPIICAPCGGKKTGYRCHKCGKDTPK